MRSIEGNGGKARTITPCVNSVAQAAGVAALRDREHLERTRALNLAEKAFVQAGLERLGLQVVPS
ncbi:MAG TPA: hypothetical protein VJU61_27100, partial [Polyangiaceae bacterium]|nr:hypothetical protein [Polyangiaceae bacterium]